MIVSTVVLGTAATPADAGTPSSGQVATNWAPWTGNSGQIFTTWFGEYNNPASPKYHKVPIIDDQKIYGIVFDRGLFEYDIAPDGVTVTMTRIGERSGENLSTLAVDGSRQARISKDNLYYMWAWDGRKIFRVPEDSNTAEWIEVPAPSATYQWAGGGWSGGEVIQNTGELFLSGNEGYRLSTAANCQNTTSTEAFVMMIFNPETKNWRASGKICPQTPSDAVTHDNSNGGRVASDMALDGAGNAYILVQEGSDSTKRATLMRVVPAPASSPNIPWTYNKVKSGIPLGNQYMAWGMAFHNGKLYAGREWYDTYYDIINPLSGERQAFQGPTNLWVQDFAATQTAMVIDGKIYNDKNGNGRIDAGEEGAAGIKVAIYQLINGNYVLQGSLDTDASGSYSALLPGKGDYVVRVVQPQISGINAVQTWAKGEYLSESDGIDSTTPVCWNEGGSVGDIDFDGPCFGAKKMPAADPVLGAVGSTADPSTFAIYTTARVQSVRDVAEADFGIHAGGSFGDLGPATVATNMPYHINAGADKPPVWLGETLGSYTAAGDNASAHGTDDGVNLAMAYSADGSGTELNNQLFAAGKEYTLEAHVSGSGFNTATVQGWLASNNSATFPATPTWETNPSWVPSGTGEVREGTITFNTANHYALRVDASPSGSVITRPTNSLYEYYDSAKSGAVPWVTFGEIEDYQFRVVNSVARPALKTSGGLGSATISSPSGTDSWSRNLSVNGGPALGMPGVALSGTYTISNVPTEFTVVDIVAKDSLLGSTVGGVITAVQTTSDGATFTYTPENFSDVILEVTIAKKPDPAKSTIELLTPSGVPVGTTQVARASVVEAGNVVMPGATVTFTSDDNNLTMCPADAVDKNATTCVADTMTCTTNSLGQCSVELFSTKASTFTDKVSASIVLGGIPVNLGPAPGTKLSPIFTQSSADLKNSWFEVAPVADPSGTTMLNWQSVTTSTTSGAYTVMATIKDSYGNGVTGLTDAEVVFAASVPQVTCGNWSETGQGVYTSTCSSTLAAKDITVGVKVNSVNLTTNTTTVASDPGAVVGLPIPFKAGPVDPTPSCGNGLMGSNLSVDFDMLDVGEVSHATALVTDENCNPLADIEVSFSIDSSTVGTLDVIRNRTDATGEAFAEVTGIDAGVVNLTATVDVDGDDVDITNSPTPITFLVGDFDPATTEFTVAPCLGLTSTTVSADGVDCWVGTITAKDSTGTLITGLNAGALSGFGFPLTPAGQVMVSPIDTSKASLGKYEVTYTSTIAGSYTAEATIDGVLVTGGTGGGTIVFTAGLPAETCTDSTNSGRLGTALWTETPSVSVGDQAMISARVTDEFCNPIVGADIDFSLVAGSSATFVGPAIAETSHTGVASAVITDDVAETVGVQASLGSINFGGTTVEVTFTAGGLSATNSTFTVTQCDVSASVVVADGVECWKGTLTPKDSLGNTVSLSPAELNTFTWGAYSAGLPTDLVTISGLNNNGDITYIVTYTSTTAGDYQVAVSYGGIQVGNTETISFVAGTPSVTTPQECVAGKPGTRLYGEAGYGNVTTKTAGSSATVTALVTDENCNPVTGVEVSFASDSSTAVFSSVTATTNDQGIATVSLSDTSAGTVNVTASIPTDQMIIHGSPVVIEFTAGTPSVTTPEECVAGKPGTRIYGEAGFGNVTTKTAGSSATVTALVTDENCNPVAGVAVMFAHDSSSALLSPVTAVMTNDQGIATVSLSDASAGTVNVTASIPTDQMIVHGSPVVIEFTAGTPTVTTPQECAPGKPGTRIYGEAGYGKVTTKTAGSAATLTALVTDENCNPVTGVEVSFASDSSTAVFSSVTAITNDQGLATVSLSDTTAGTVNVTASIPTDQMIIHGSPVVIEFTAGTPTVTTPQECAPGKPGTGIYGEAGFGETTMKEAGEWATITALVTDENCNPVTGVEVSFASDSSTATFSSATATTNIQGLAIVSLHDTTAGIVNVTGTIATGTITHGSPATVEYTAAAIATTCTKPDGSPGVGTNISANPTSAEVGGSVEIIALVTDEYCNPISGASVAFATTGDATFTASTQTTGDDGYARTTLTDDTAEMVNVTAKINSSIAITEGSPAQVTFLAGSADPTKSTFTVAPCDSLAPSVVANGSDCWRGTLRVVDSKMNPLAGLDAANLALFNFSTPDAVVASSLVDRGDGTYVVTYTSTVAGSYLVSVSYNSSTPVSIGSGTITFVAGTPQVDVDENNCAPGRRGTSELVTPTTLTIDQTAEVTVYVTDAYCNPIVGETVTVHVTGSASLGATTLTTDEAGLVRTTVNDVKAETVTVSSQVAAGQIPSPTQVTFAAGELNPAMSDFIVYRSAGNADPSKVRADGIESWTGEFIPRDSGGNLVTAANPVDSAQLVVTVDSAVSVTSGTAGTYTWLFTSLTYDTAFVVELSLDGARVGTTQTITFTDADAPEPPVITHPVTGSWFNTTPDIAGTDGEPGSTITVTDAKGEVLCTSIASADESWSCAPNRTLSEGRYMITATATDSEGNVSEPSAPVSFTIKTTPPTKPVVDSSNGSKVTGQGEPGSSVSVVDEDGNPVPGCSDVEVDSTGRFECVPETPLTPGQSITVTVTDPAGNTSPPVTIEIVPLMAVATHPLRYRGEVQVVSGYNFNPGESVSLTVYSDPFAAGTAVVNADGTVTITFIIPDDMEYGFHTAILTGVESGSAYVTFEVIAKPAAPVAPEIPYVPTGGVVQGGSWLAIYLLIAGSLVSFVGFLMVRIRRNSDAK
ncbi:MAG: Ig-like domain-containing protein [Propionibacteriaceae bacterium]|nr:Ig-like domain-containing protein [Propionibacteriaceae bacterium]